MYSVTTAQTAVQKWMVMGMAELLQKVNRHEKSICCKCSHRFVCIGIDNQPCFECNQFAEEVVHGEWIMVIDENDCECIECPLCGEQFYDGDNDTFDKPYNYCPNCGAKMDLKGD